jgi:hypothetical protein
MEMELLASTPWMLLEGPTKESRSGSKGELIFLFQGMLSVVSTCYRYRRIKNK